MTEFSALRVKTYSYLTDNDSKGSKAKDTKKCVIKQKRKFEDYQHFLEAPQLENKINQLDKKFKLIALEAIIKNS